MDHFREGERVRTRVAKLGLPVGTTGTIRRVFQSASGTYDVAFDGVPQPVIAHGSQLEPAENEKEASS
jgi:hypothetical protein